MIGLGIDIMRRRQAGGVAPAIRLSGGHTIAENAAAGTFVGTLSVVGVTGTPAFTLDDTAGNRFALDGADLEAGATATNYEAATSHTPVVSVSGVTPSIDPTPFVITVTNVNEAPTVANAIADQDATEDEAFTFQFASNTFADVDAGTTLTYTATKSDNSPLPAWLTFTPATRTFSGTPAGGDVGTLSVKVTASDGALTVSDTFDIVIASATVTLTDLALDNATIAEDANVGTLVGTLSGMAVGSTLSLFDDAGGLFELDGNDIKVADALDFEGDPSHDITVRETLAGATNTPHDTVLTITLTDVDEGIFDISGARGINVTGMEGDTWGTSALLADASGLADCLDRFNHVRIHANMKAALSAYDPGDPSTLNTFIANLKSNIDDVLDVDPAMKIVVDLRPGNTSPWTPEDVTPQTGAGIDQTAWITFKAVETRIITELKPYAKTRLAIGIFNEPPLRTHFATIAWQDFVEDGHANARAADPYRHLYISCPDLTNIEGLVDLDPTAMLDGRTGIDIHPYWGNWTHQGVPGVFAHMSVGFPLVPSQQPVDIAAMEARVDADSGVAAPDKATVKADEASRISTMYASYGIQWWKSRWDAVDDFCTTYSCHDAMYVGEFGWCRNFMANLGGNTRRSIIASLEFTTSEMARIGVDAGAVHSYPKDTSFGIGDAVTGVFDEQMVWAAGGNPQDAIDTDAQAIINEHTGLSTREQRTVDAIVKLYKDPEVDIWDLLDVECWPIFGEGINWKDPTSTTTDINLNGTAAIAKGTGLNLPGTSGNYADLTGYTFAGGSSGAGNVMIAATFVADHFVTTAQITDAWVYTGLGLLADGIGGNELIADRLRGAAGDLSYLPSSIGTHTIGLAAEYRHATNAYKPRINGSAPVSGGGTGPADSAYWSYTPSASEAGDAGASDPIYLGSFGASTPVRAELGYFGFGQVLSDDQILWHNAIVQMGHRELGVELVVT